MTEITWPAPAKLNLFLHINGREADGYHHIQTLFQILDWGDKLQFVITDDGIVSRENDVVGVPAETDLCIGAATLLQAHCGVRRGARIRLTKNIPIGAGLGGGSSDAATVLHALNHLWGCGIDVDELAQLGLALGADVPLFVRGHSAWGQGRGEILEPMTTGQPWFVLLMPDVMVSTASVFNDPELPRNHTMISPRNYDYKMTVNDCQKVVLSRHPRLMEMLNDVSQYGEWRMSGTGSSFFLPVDGKESANSITHFLKSRYNVRAVRGVDRSALLGCAL